jgi:hypothetical protein
MMPCAPAYSPWSEAKTDDGVLRHVAWQGGENLPDPLVHDAHDVGVGVLASLPVVVGRDGNTDGRGYIGRIALDPEVRLVRVFARNSAEDRCRAELR